MKLSGAFYDTSFPFIASPLSDIAFKQEWALSKPQVHKLINKMVTEYLWTWVGPCQIVTK